MLPLQHSPILSWIVGPLRGEKSKKGGKKEAGERDGKEVKRGERGKEIREGGEERREEER